MASRIGATEHRVGGRCAHLGDHWNLSACYHGSDFHAAAIRRDKAPPARATHRPYHAILRADLGTTPYGFSLTTGHLPPGLRLRHGSIIGRPRRTGTYRFTIRVRDASRPPTRASRRLAITVRR